jgi:hypothetical protein
VYFYSCANSFKGKLNTEHLSHHVNVLQYYFATISIHITFVQNILHFSQRKKKISHFATCHLSAPIYKIRLPCAPCTKLFSRPSLPLGQSSPISQKPSYLFSILFLNLFHPIFLGFLCL